MHNLVEDALRDLPLRGLGHFDNLMVSEDRDSIAFGVKTNAFAGNIVHDDGVEMLCSQFLTSVLKNVFRLGSKANYNLTRLSKSNFLQNVGRGFEFERHRAFAFELLRRGRFGPVVGDRGSFNDYRGLRQQVEHGVAHLFRRLDSPAFRSARRCKRRGAADQQHASATAQCGFGESVAHAPAGAVGEIAYRINLLAGRPSGDQNGFTGEILSSAQGFENGGYDGIIFGKTPGA